MELPLFPLHLVLFPGRPLPLHIFEDRYRQMLHDCRDADGLIGVVAIRSGREAGGGAETFQVGTVARIDSVTTHPDGRSDITTRGCSRFRILEPLDGTPYRRARVELLEDAADIEDRTRAKQLRALLVPYLASLGAPAELLARLPSDPGALAYLAASALHVELAEQQRLLELSSCSARLEEAVAILRRENGLMRHLGAVGSLRPPGPNGADLN
jgi:Lon protease-like protein